MKLLLTSGGITNESIKKAFIDLIGKIINEVVVVFITTASNVEKDKSWMLEDIENIEKTGVAKVEQVDIEALTREQYLPILKSSDAICFGGGNTYHLLKWIRQSGLIKELDNLLKSRLYMGISAGTCVAGIDISLTDDLFPEDEHFDIGDNSGLKYVPFDIVPHLMSKYFTKARPEEVEKIAVKVKYPIYAIDDNTAIKINDGKVEIISEGFWKKYN